ncbi:peptidylprolyl isomerase [Sesbania bispinosa]|nr:peptidylprolyl isomerase [Sesbania bispinosa]
MNEALGSYLGMDGNLILNVNEKDLFEDVVIDHVINGVISDQDILSQLELGEDYFRQWHGANLIHKGEAAVGIPCDEVHVGIEDDGRGHVLKPNANRNVLLEGVECDNGPEQCLREVVGPERDNGSEQCVRVAVGLFDWVCVAGMDRCDDGSFSDNLADVP